MNVFTEYKQIKPSHKMRETKFSPNIELGIFMTSLEIMD